MSQKVPTFILSVTVNLNWFSHFLHCWKAYEFATKRIQHYHLTLGVLLHYLGKSNIQISGRLLTVPVSQNVFNSLLAPRFVQRFSGNSSVNLFAVYLLNTNFILKSCPRRWIPCWLLQALQWHLLWGTFGDTSWLQKLITKRTITWKIYFQSILKKTPHF